MNYKIKFIQLSFHRAFNLSDYYNRISEGPIQVNTILTLDVNTGDIIYGWGANMFYMPHGITIDQYGSTWITDCAMHQVMKVIQI